MTRRAQASSSTLTTSGFISVKPGGTMRRLTLLWEAPLITHAIRREAHKTVNHGLHRSVLHYTMLSSCQSAPDYLPNIRLNRARTVNTDEKRGLGRQTANPGPSEGTMNPCYWRRLRARAPRTTEPEPRPASAMQAIRLVGSAVCGVEPLAVPVPAFWLPPPFVLFGRSRPG